MNREEDLEAVQQFLAGCDRIKGISVSKSIRSNRIYFLLDRFDEVTTVVTCRHGISPQWPTLRVRGPLSLGIGHVVGVTIGGRALQAPLAGVPCSAPAVATSQMLFLLRPATARRRSHDIKNLPFDRSTG